MFGEGLIINTEIGDGAGKVRICHKLGVTDIVVAVIIRVLQSGKPFPEFLVCTAGCLTDKTVRHQLSI